MIFPIRYIFLGASPIVFQVTTLLAESYYNRFSSVHLRQGQSRSFDMNYSEILTISYGSTYGALMFGTSMYCARETMKESKGAKDNKSVDQKTNETKPTETSNAIQDEKANDADTDIEAGLFYAKWC